MIDEKTYDEIDRYLRGEMSAEERAAFDARLSSDEALRAEVEWLSVAFRATGKLMMKSQLAEIFAGVPSASLVKYTPSKNGQGFLKKWWWAGVMFVAASAAVIWWNSPRGEERAPQEPARDTAPAPQKPNAAPAFDPPAADSFCSDSVTTVMHTTTIHHDTLLPSGEKKSSVVVEKDSVIKIISTKHYGQPQKK